MHAQLPSLRPDELEIWVGNAWLELAAEHRRAPRVPCCLLGGPRRLSFSRRYPLGLPVATERSQARLVDGRLHLHLPKRSLPAEDRIGRVRIPVSG
jgi:HSP20 family molecular chaperone IbpA